MAPRLTFTDDPAAFLDVAGERLADDPVLTTVVATVAVRAAARVAEGREPPAYPQWWVTVTDDDGRLVGVAMRTAPFAPHPLYVLPMPDDAARLLAAALVERGEVVAANGALPAARVVSDELARLTGARVEVSKHTRLFALDAVVAPPRPAGRLRPASYDEDERCLAWFRAFSDDAAAQAGRAPEPGRDEQFDLDEIRDRIAGGRILVWEAPDGEVVHLTGVNVPAFGVVRIGPVYTPSAHRGRGYASAAVAEASQQVLDAGLRPCLFTDQANPTSNRIYQALGYEAVVDTAEHVLR